MTYVKARVECVRQAEAQPGTQFYAIKTGQAYSVVTFDEFMEIRKQSPRLTPVFAYYVGESYATETVFE